MTTPKKKTTPARKTTTANLAANLRERVLDDLAALKVPISAEMLDAALSLPSRRGLSHLSFLELIFGEPATRSRRRAVERRIRDAKFHEERTWRISTGPSTPRPSTARRSSNSPPASSSAAARTSSWSAKAASERAISCKPWESVSANWDIACVTPPAPSCCKSCGPRWRTRACRVASARGRVSTLVIIDEFGFDRIERNECPEAANLFYKLIDARSGKRSTALGTNIDFEKWTDYLGDPPLALAFLDRVVYRATC